MNLAKRFFAAVRAFWGWDKDQRLNWTHGPMTIAGTRVNEITSLTISSLFSALNFLAGTIASLPKVIYRRLPNGEKVKAYEHPLYDRLHNRPNESNMTSWQWIYTSIMHKYLWGNWYTYINRLTYKNQQLIPLLPDRTWPDPANEERIFSYMKAGSTIPQLISLPRDLVLHIPHISLDGVQGKGIIYYARESLGLAKAQDEFAATYFGNGIHPSILARINTPMTEETRNGLQKDFNEKYGGLNKNWKAIFISGIDDIKTVDIDANKAQALESRQFSVVEVARWTNLPPHIIRDLSRATFNNIEQMEIELVVYSLLSLTTQIEQSMNIAFFDEEERKDHYIKFELKGLLRGDIKARTEFYRAMLDRGVFNADDVLDLEDMNFQPNGLGKVFLVPLNMLNKEQVIGPQQLTIENKDKSNIEKSAIKIIQKRSSALRRKITIAYKKKFDDYGQQIVKKETDAIREAMKEMLSKKGITEFNTWLDTFYQNFGKEIDALSAPLISNYADAVLPVAQEEINSSLDISPQYSNFEKEYREYFVNRHIKSSQGQLRSVIREAQQAKENEEEAIERRLAEWEEKRPGKISMRETVRAESAFAKSVFALAGITKIVSVSFGKSCPYCNALDGMVIGIDQFFLKQGEFQPEGADEPLTVTSNRSHPPYHDGCDCGIMAEI